jgi:trimethylamine--corrinoid protein Co-methyltransferase
MRQAAVGLKLLTKARLNGIVSRALDLLATHGVFVESHVVRNLLLSGGATTGATGRLRLGEELVLQSVATVPPRFTMHGSDGAHECLVGGGGNHFDPGSAALNLYDPKASKARRPTTEDCIQLHRVVDQLEHYHFQSTAMIPADVPESLADRYRLYLALLVSPKPVVTGTFRRDGFRTMRAMLEIVRGGATELREKPLAIFDCCPSPPLKWATLGSEDLVDCARSGIPAELVSMPLSGATAPATLYGSMVQHCAENLSGIVIHQLAVPGAPIVYGGSPAIMDMRWGTTPMGAIETMIMDCANAQVGKLLGLPTHAYMGLSDSKLPDYQAGLESGLGSVLAVLAGVDVVSGAGMLDFESCQSLEKIVLDHDAVGMALRLSRGIGSEGRDTLLRLFEDLLERGDLITHKHTARHYRREQFMPGAAVDRRPGARWEAEGRADALTRATERVEQLLAQSRLREVSSVLTAELREILERDFDREGAPLPEIERFLTASDTEGAGLQDP